MRFRDLYDETGIVPSAERFACCYINRPFSIWAGNWDRQICFSRRTVNVRVSGNEKSLCDGRAETFNYGRVRLGSRQGLFVNVSGFHGAEHDECDRGNKRDEQYQHAEGANWHEPIPVSLPPVGSWRKRDRRILLHGVFLLQPRSFVQSILVTCALLQA